MKINFDALLAPINDVAPCGSNIEYEQVYDDIRRARESDPDYLPQGEWTTELRVADWAKVVKLSCKVLCEESKDLQVACWFIEGITQQQGITGLLSGMAFLQQFASRYWDDCWPALAEDGHEFRQSSLNRLDRDLTLLLKTYPMLGQQESSLDYWQKVVAWEHQGAPKTDDETSGDSDDFSMTSYNRWAAALSAEKLISLKDSLQELTAAVDIFEQQYSQLTLDADSTALGQTRQVIVEMQEWAKRMIDRLGPINGEIATESSGEQPLASPLYSGMTRHGMSRGEAINQILTIADFFRQTEPSSPLPLLLERAARWGEMTLTEWLEEMLQDGNSLQSINNVLKGQQSE
ncbi:type VI secretion system protein TssA [Yersinia enterocolitica]|uniref:type VI secretion system protein TssA n=1 Tax=Yersinia enterocolitica TaxID=630 RepID=UPI000978BB7A|nr:type VI secretion system protein TssA [Yersinia enterocolitica]ELI7922706.1 type VI secretion system protein TssA [Yersinia enterocolitica]